MAKPQPKPAPERRRTALRSQVQAWFEALRLHIGEIEGAEALANRIQGWSKPEDIMRAYPVLVPLFLDLIWRSRKTAGFAELLQTESGEIAEKPTDVLAMSQKTFDDIVISHLLGTARLTCERLQKEWIAREREKRRHPLSRIPALGAALRALGFFQPAKAETLLVDFPQKGLYEALKPFLTRRAQFPLVEAMATLPTRTVAALGAIVGALESPAAIRALANLNKSDFKIVFEMAETYVQATDGPPAGTEGGSAAESAAPLAQALSHMLGAGPDLLALALMNRQLVKDAIVKLGPVMKEECWATFKDAEALRRIVECPPAIAETLKAAAGEMHQRVSMLLSEIEDTEVAAFAMKTMRETADPDLFLSWIRDESHLSAWKQFLAHLKRDAGGPRAVGALGQPIKTAIKSVCEKSARVFSETAAPEEQAA
jgi:hypothetical protein